MNDELELIWRDYKLHVDLSRSYLDIVIKLNLFYYAISGAILSYVFLHAEESQYIKWALWLPILMSIAFGIYFFDCVKSASTQREYIASRANELNFKVHSEGNALVYLLIIFAIMFVIMSIGLFAAFCIL